MEPYAWRRIYTFCIRQPTSQHPVGSSLVIPKSPQVLNYVWLCFLLYLNMYTRSIQHFSLSLSLHTRTNKSQVCQLKGNKIPHKKGVSVYDSVLNQSWVSCSRVLINLKSSHCHRYSEVYSVHECILVFIGKNKVLWGISVMFLIITCLM